MKCQLQSLGGSFGSVHGDFGWTAGVYLQLLTDLHIDHTAAFSLDCSALRMHCLLLLGEGGDIDHVGSHSLNSASTGVS